MTPDLTFGQFIVISVHKEKTEKERKLQFVRKERRKKKRKLFFCTNPALELTNDENWIIVAVRRHSKKSKVFFTII
jgi:hypothetical protein